MTAIAIYKAHTVHSVLFSVEIRALESFLKVCIALSLKLKKWTLTRLDFGEELNPLTSIPAFRDSYGFHQPENRYLR